MAEVADHLAPTDGLTNSRIRFAGLDTIDGSGAATLRFDLYDEEKRYVGTFPVTVGPQPQGTVDALIAAGFVEMRNVLRQWLWAIDRTGSNYAARNG